MPIEFQCQSCNKNLRIPDAAVGKQVKCPSCQQVSTVPAASTGPTTPPAGNPYAADPNRGQTGLGSNPYAAPNTAASHAPAEPTGHGRLEATKAVSAAWMLFKEHIGILVGTFVVMMVINQVVSYMLQFLQALALAGAGGGQQGGGLNQPQTIILVLTTLVVVVIGQVIQGFLSIGMIRIQLGIARGQQTDFGMLFSGGRWLVKMVLANLLFGLIVGLGFVALIIPGIYLALRYWSFAHFIVDKDCGIMESFTLAGEASKDNLGETFVLFLIGFGLVILGLLMLCIGILFTTPIFNLSLTIGYLMMTSQRYRQAL